MQNIEPWQPGYYLSGLMYKSTRKGFISSLQVVTTCSPLWIINSLPWPDPWMGPARVIVCTSHMRPIQGSGHAKLNYQVIR